MAKTTPPEICRLPSLLRHFLMIDGPNRAGKSTVVKVVTSLERVELERIEEIYDYVGFLTGLGKIEMDAATALLRTYADIHVYNLYLSRNVNCRPGDHSSIFRSARPFTYLRRFLAKDHDEATARIATEAPILSQHTHYQMENIGIFFDAFADRIRVIEVLRHPVDLVHEVVERGYGEDVCASLYNVHICLRHGDGSVPLLARGWEGEFLRMGPYDRVVRMLHGYQMRSRKTLQSLSDTQRAQVHVAVFEDVLANPAEEARRMANFLGTRTTAKTSGMIRRAGCPRTPSPRERERRFRELRENCTSASLALLDEMITDYEVGWAC